MPNTQINTNTKYIFIAILYLCISVCSSKAENWYPLNVLSTNNGLPTNEVKQVYQDKEGYIWLATEDGLCRYDGFQLKIYKTNLYTPGLLSSNNITAIAEDNNHNIWIGTPIGLNILNKITGEIKQIESSKLLGSHIQKILVTKDNHVWIGTSNGLNKYNSENESFAHFDNAATNYTLRGNDIKTLIEDNKGNIWIGTWNEGITRLDPSKNIFHPYPKINEQNSAHIIFEDEENNIWVGSWGYGLFRLENPYDPERVKYINYSHNKNNPNSLSDNIVYALSQDLNTKSIWVGTRSGLSILNNDKNTCSFTNHLPNQSEQSILYNEVNSIIRDNSGLMWMGTLGGGVSVVNTQKSIFTLNSLDKVKNILSSNSVRSIYVDNKGIEWMGIGSYGLVARTPENDQYIFYENHPDFSHNPIKTTIYMIIQPQKSNSYWFATHGEGIFIYDPSSTVQKVKNIRTESHKWLSNSRVYYLKEDCNGCIWIGTASGISIYNTNTGKGIAYPLLGQKADDNKSFQVYCIEEENASTMWLGTVNDGLFKVTKDPLTSDILGFTHYGTENKKLNNNNIECTYKDSKERLWLGSKGGGLCLYDKKLDAFISVHQKYNLPGDIISSIKEDNMGNLWLGTNAGLVMLQVSNENIISSRNYSIADGMQDNAFYRNVAFKTKDGILYFGGHKGYNYFDPQKRQEQNQKFPIVITDIKIYNKSIESLDEDLRSKISLNAPGYTTEIQLPYKYNNFSFEFSALTYASSSQNKYAYMLSDFDKEWQYTDDSRRFAAYNNLKSGKYKFFLKSSNENGIWNNDKIITVDVSILPPPWLTWWAYLIYFILTTLVIYIFVKVAKNKMTLKNALRIKNMEKLKTEELNHAKLQFFTNITHEFLTPLTILSASVDELKMQTPQNSDYFNVMSSNINRLIRLLQQILEFRKAETGNLKLKVSKGDIASFIKSGVDSFKPLMKKNKIHFSLVCEPESISAYFDHDKLDKILFNLLSNASKYNRQGGFVLVNVSYDSEDKNYAIISVKDNGEGINPQNVKGLFKRFYEGDYRRFNTTGTGIGLSLTKDLVDLHKGEITVESEVEKGTTFFVKLPINHDAYTDDEIDDYVYIAKEVQLEDFKNKEDEIEINKNLKDHSLLLVEDNEELLQLMIKLLSKQYNIFTARNGKEGIEILETEYIDLAISDIMMPIMDGMEFCKYVKNDFEMSHVPIILLTAKNKEEDRIDAYNSGADGFISKPFNLNVLYSKIKNLLKSRERATQKFKKQFIYEAKEMNYTSIDEEFLNNAVDCVHQYIDDINFDQKQFADAMGISKSTLYKKLKSLTDLNTSLFIRNIRLKTACKVIEEKKKIRISELAYSVGFNDPKYFSACFKKEFGLIPSEYLDKILIKENKEVNMLNEE